MTFVAGTVLTAAALNSELAAKTDLAMTQNAQTGTSYSFALADASKLLTMNNAASNTVTVTKQATVTWVTGTQLRVMNLGAGVTTLVADTGVTINGNVALKQYQGGTLIRTASDVWLFVPTASGSGIDLITPTSVAGTGVTLSGGQVSFSAVTTASVNGCFSATYDNYLIDITCVGGAREVMSARLRVAGTDNTAANYQSQFLKGDGTAIDAARSTNQTSMRIGAVDTSSSILLIHLASPFLTAKTAGQNRCNFMADTTPTVDLEAFGHSTATSFDGFTIITASAMTGKLRVYGLRNS